MAEFGDAGEALRAKVVLARHHAEELRAQAHKQRFQAREQREAELRAVDAAKRGTHLEGELAYCAHCGAIWRVDAVREATRRHAGCLVCGRPLAPVP